METFGIEFRLNQCENNGREWVCMEEKKHDTNQVWNTDIDKEQNRQNSRIALIVLGVSVALLIGLVAVLLGQLSSMTTNLPEISFEEFFAKREPQPAPEPDRSAYADEAFLRTAAVKGFRLLVPMTAIEIVSILRQACQIDDTKQ